MNVKTKKLNKPLGERDFMNEVYKRAHKFRAIEAAYNEQVSLLAKRYLAANCTFKVGNSIAIADSPDGFTLFTIDKLIPDVRFDLNKVRVKAIGTMTGEGVEPAEKMIWLDELKKHEPANEVEAAKQEVEAAHEQE